MLTEVGVAVVLPPKRRRSWGGSLYVDQEATVQPSPQRVGRPNEWVVPASAGSQRMSCVFSGFTFSLASAAGLLADVTEEEVEMRTASAG